MSIVEKMFTSGGFQRLVNRKRISARAGRLASRELSPWLLRRMIKWFIRAEGVNMEEYEQEIEDFKTFNEFFTRRLKEGARSFEAGIASPVDGYISEIEKIQEGQLLQVKGRYYSLNDLVDDHFSFMKGSFATIYLSPADYHRIHAPFEMQIDEVSYIPGDLYSVNDASVHKIDRLFCRNERVVLKGRSDYGAFYFVLVGAIVVGKIKLVFMPFIDEGETAVNVKLRKGEELGMFELGSTIIMALDNELLTQSEWKKGNKIRMGQSLYNEKAD